ncbi:MAG TPA: LacI family DNA-binding transcriptional regulator [Longimicrobiaceae bacterium]
MKPKRATIQDVAREAGVSKATVSAAMNNTGTIAAATRNRVLEVAARLNYRPAAVKRNQGAAPKPTIGMLIREINNPYHVEVAAGASRWLEKNGYGFVVTASGGHYDTERIRVEMLCERELDGIIINPVLHEGADLSYLYELRRRNFPFVLLSGIYGVRASLVDVDNVQASWRAVSYLIRHGHTRIVHLAGPSFAMHSQERIEGVRRAFSESHLVFRNDIIVRAGHHLEDGYRAGKELFTKRPRAEWPTAVTCYNDLVALGLYRALSELGLSVPEDVSIIGYGDLPVLEYLPVPLTTVHVPKLKMGETAARLLVRLIESDLAEAPERVNLETELVVRKSTRSLLPPEAEEEPKQELGPADEPAAAAPRRVRARKRSA